MQMYSETLILQVQFTFRCFQEAFHYLWVWGHKPQHSLRRAGCAISSRLPPMMADHAKHLCERRVAGLYWIAPRLYTKGWLMDCQNPTKENHPSMHALPYGGRVAPIAAPCLWPTNIRKIETHSSSDHHALMSWIAHGQEALWNTSLWFRMCRKLNWQHWNTSTSL